MRNRKLVRSREAEGDSMAKSKSLLLDLDALLAVERRKTLRVIVVTAWVIFFAFLLTRPFIHFIVPGWYILLLAGFALLITGFYKLSRIRTGFLVGSFGGFILFVIQYFSVGVPDWNTVISATTIMSLVGTLYFRRRYLFYANAASLLLLAIGVLHTLQTNMSDQDRFDIIIDGVGLWGFVTVACWLFITRSLRLLEKLSEAKEALMMDSLTATYNRVYFDAALNNLELNQQPNMVSLFILDVDHFKHVNDHYGHLVGDQVLAHFTHLIKNTIRRADVLTRIGGEEFSIIIHHDHRLDLNDYAERLLRVVREHPYHTDSGLTVSLTTSIGGATFLANEESIHSCLNRADQALYQAKASGRNCAVLAM